MIEQPDHAGLVSLLPTLRRLVDATGLVMLEPEEAGQIRSLGFDAQTGFWHVPPLPAALVAGNPLLEPLGDHTDRFWRPCSESRPSHQTEIAELNGVESLALATGAGEAPGGATEPSEISDPAAWNKESAAILSALTRAGGTTERRRLQKKLWRMKAAQFNQAMASLVEHGLIRFEGKIIAASPGQCTEKEL